jgi:hypothetical protein
MTLSGAAPPGEARAAVLIDLSVGDELVRRTSLRGQRWRPPSMRPLRRLHSPEQVASRTALDGRQTARWRLSSRHPKASKQLRTIELRLTRQSVPVAQSPSAPGTSASAAAAPSGCGPKAVAYADIHRALEPFFGAGSRRYWKALYHDDFSDAAQPCSGRSRWSTTRATSFASIRTSARVPEGKSRPAAQTVAADRRPGPYASFSSGRRSSRRSYAHQR